MANNKENMADKPMYDNPEKLQKLIDEYFADDTKYPIKTITGLVLHCGFCDRKSFYDYEKKELFVYPIKRARTRIENIYEERLQGNNVAGAIFALKNFGWRDDSHIDFGKETLGTLTALANRYDNNGTSRKSNKALEE